MIMEGLITSYRRSRHTQTSDQMIVGVQGVDSRGNASKLVGKKVTFKTPSGKEIQGEVRGAHGNSGAVRVLFETGMPGQSLGAKVSIN